MKILFATNNPHKLQEVQALLKGNLELSSLSEAGIEEDIPETGRNLAENALLKARYGAEKTGLPTFADDTGLEVGALNGAPGVHSARFAGPEKDPQANIELLLEKLQGAKNRSAHFRTVIAWVNGQQEETFEGEVAGFIQEAPSGESGFGYDPVFRPAGYRQTFAQMPLEYKNKISHRAKAMEAFSKFLNEAYGQ